MYVIDKSANRIAPLTTRTFKAESLDERKNLQEWMAYAPSVFGEDLLIIQKEFDGFDGTYERLGLLALDKEGDVVVIENKLDDSGRDVTWQALKYASYCSTLKKEDIRGIYQQYLDKYEPGAKADQKITEFFDGRDYKDIVLNEGARQRIIMVAARFRKEVTSTVLWLMNYGLRLQCFKVGFFRHNDQLFMNMEQILPTPDTAELVISMASKTQEVLAAQKEGRISEQQRREFWTYFLGRVQGRSSMFSSSSPTTNQWLGAGLGMSGVSISIVATSAGCRVEIFINRGDKAENKLCFDELLKDRSTIERDFAAPLVWERLDGVTSRIRFDKTGVNVYEREDWDQITDFLIDGAERLQKAFKGPVKKLNEQRKRARGAASNED